MNPVDSNSSNGFISASYPLDLVDQAREVMLGADQELFSATSAEISETENDTELSELSYQLTSRLDEFSTLLSSTEFFSDSFSDQIETAAEDATESDSVQTPEDVFQDRTDSDEPYSSSLDIEAHAQSVRTVIDEYNGLVEWLDSSQASINPSLKADLFKEVDSNVLEEMGSGTSKTQGDTFNIHSGGTASQDLETNSFSPQVSEASESSAEATLSKVGLTLNADGTLEVEDDFEQQFKSNFSDAYSALSGEDGFFTKISSALDTLNDRDSRFNVYTGNDNTQAYTGDPDTQVQNAYRENVASVLNLFA